MDNKTPAPPTEEQKIVASLFEIGTAAAAFFVKNPNHVQTASTITQILGGLLPDLERLFHSRRRIERDQLQEPASFQLDWFSFVMLHL